VGAGSPNPRSADRDRVVVGRVLRGHGIRGACIVVPLTDVPERFAVGARMAVGSTGDDIEVTSCAPYKGRLLVQFDAVADRTAADALRGVDLWIAAADAGPPPEGTVWAADLEGLPVCSPDGVHYGTVTGVAPNPAHDILVCADPDGREFMVPLVAAFVDELEPGMTRVTLHPIPGLLPEPSSGPDADADATDG
jgi:16S rRNA processing protein RimM